MIQSLNKRPRMANTKTKIKLKVRIPHLVIDARDADPKLLKAMASGLEEVDARIRILGHGPKELARAFSSEEALEEAHMWLILGDKLPAEFDLMMERGIVPIMKQGLHKKAENYNPSQENGNAFIFPKLTEWYAYGSLVRAIENYQFSYDWNNIKNNTKEFLS